jgi:hypothetical protein
VRWRFLLRLQSRRAVAAVTALAPHCRRLVSYGASRANVKHTMEL